MSKFPDLFSSVVDYRRLVLVRVSSPTVYRIDRGCCIPGGKPGKELLIHPHIGDHMPVVTLISPGSIEMSVVYDHGIGPQPGPAYEAVSG